LAEANAAIDLQHYNAVATFLHQANIQLATTLITAGISTALTAPSETALVSDAEKIFTTRARVQQLANVAESGEVTWVAGDAKASAAYSDAMAAAKSNAGGRQGFNLLRNRLGTRIDLEGPIHHWRFPMSQYPGEAMAAENLYLTEGGGHLGLHRAIGATGAPYNSMAWGSQTEIQSMFNFWNMNTSVPTGQVLGLLPK
jgi:hypothetical protein